MKYTTRENITELLKRIGKIVYKMDGMRSSDPCKGCRYDKRLPEPGNEYSYCDQDGYSMEDIEYAHHRCSSCSMAIAEPWFEVRIELFSGTKVVVDTGQGLEIRIIKPERMRQDPDDDDVDDENLPF